MATSFSVLWKKTGEKGGFRKAKTARVFAQKKANKINETVDIDRIKTFPKAKVGETDFTQRHHCYIKPKRTKKNSF